jgi:hypothetical protein
MTSASTSFVCKAKQLFDALAKRFPYIMGERGLQMQDPTEPQQLLLQQQQQEQQQQQSGASLCSSGLQIYHHYLQQNILHPSMSLAHMADLTPSQIGLFYREKESSMEPRFFSFANFADLNKLCRTLGINLVIYSLSQGKQERVQKYYDSRLMTACLSQQERPTCFYKMTGRPLGQGPLEEQTKEQAEKDYSPRLSEAAYIGSRCQSVTQCYAQTLFDLLNLTLPPLPMICPSLHDLFLLSMEAAAWWSLPEVQEVFRQRQVWLVHHEGKAATTSSSRPQYHVLCVFPPPFLRETQPSAHTIDVVAVTYPHWLYIPTASAKRQLLKQSGRRQGPTNALKVNHLLKDPIKSSPSSATWGKASPATSPCDCSLCQVDAKKLETNFKRAPGTGAYSQRAYHLPRVDLLEWLKIFSLDTPENIERYLSACDLTFSGMDIEAVSAPLTTPGPLSDPEILIQPYTNLAFDTTERFIQRPVLIGHRDAVDNTTHMFTVTPDTSLRQICGEYLRFLRSRREILEEKKRILLAPLYKVVDPLREAHMTFCYSRGLSESEGLSAYRSTLVGRFESQLNLLTKRYIVFCYNGSGYDFPQLMSGLACAATDQTPRARLQPHREGNRVRSMTLQGEGWTQLMFRDLMDLTSKDMSLQKLAELAQLPCSKMDFPYHQASSWSQLNQPPSWKPSDWYNPLKNEQVPPDRIYAVKRTFRQKSCKTLLDLMKVYLDVDCRLLREAGVKLLRQYYEMLGSHVVDSHLTLASYSNYVGQLYLFQHRRPAMFQASTPALQAMVSNANLGGICQVGRNVADGDPPPGEDAEAYLNAHLTAKNRPQRPSSCNRKRTPTYHFLRSEKPCSPSSSQEERPSLFHEDEHVLPPVPKELSNILDPLTPLAPPLPGLKAPPPDEPGAELAAGTFVQAALAALKHHDETNTASIDDAWTLPTVAEVRQKTSSYTDPSFPTPDRGGGDEREPHHHHDRKRQPRPPLPGRHVFAQDLVGLYSTSCESAFFFFPFCLFKKGRTAKSGETLQGSLHWAVPGGRGARRVPPKGGPAPPAKPGGPASPLSTHGCLDLVLYICLCVCF